MGINLPKANAGGNAPQVADGLGIARFDDLQLRDHDDWAGTDQYGKPDDGKRYHFLFTILDPADQKVLYDEGEPVELDAVTRTATGAKSNFAAYLKGILTPVEFASWEADQPFDAEAVQGRVVNIQVAHNKKGWPFIEQTLGQVVAKAAKKTKAQLQAEAAAALAAAEAAAD